MDRSVSRVVACAARVARPNCHEADSVTSAARTPPSSMSDGTRPPSIASRRVVSGDAGRAACSVISMKDRAPADSAINRLISAGLSRGVGGTRKRSRLQ